MSSFLDLEAGHSVGTDSIASAEEDSSSLSGFIVPDEHESCVTPPRKRPRLRRQNADVSRNLFPPPPPEAAEEAQPEVPDDVPELRAVLPQVPAGAPLPGVGGLAGTAHGRQVRINGQRLAITWPALEKAGQASCLDLAREGFNKLATEVPIECIVICREKHETSDDYHIHAYVSFHAKRKITHERLDAVVGKHGNYCRVLSQAAWLTYITKDDEYLGFNPADSTWSREFALLVVGAATAKQGVKHAKIETLLVKDGGTVLDILDSFPGYLIQHAQKVRTFQAMVSDAQQVAKRPVFAWEPIPITLGMKDHDRTIARWLNLWFNAIKAGQRPYPKQYRHLAILGAANSGKTRLTTHLMSSIIPTFLYTKDGGFMDALSDKDELVVFNDFYGSQMSYSAWKRFTDGSPFQRRVKGAAPQLWTKVIPMIFTANREPRDWWPNVVIEDDVVDSRLQVVHIPPGEHINLFGFQYD